MISEKEIKTKGVTFLNNRFSKQNKKTSTGKSYACLFRIKLSN